MIRIFTLNSVSSENICQNEKLSMGKILAEKFRQKLSSMRSGVPMDENYILDIKSEPYKPCL